MSSTNSTNTTTTPTPTTTNTTSTPTPTPTSNTTTTNTTSTPSSSGSSGGTSSAVAGTAIGVSILVVLIIAILWMKRRRRRKKRDLERRDAGHLSLQSQHTLSAATPARSIDENAPTRPMLPRALAGLLGRNIAVNSEDDFRGSSHFGPRNYSYKELRIATKNFSESELLGAGGFGSVYRGMLPEDSTYVAVKCIAEKSSQGAKEYKAEVTIISDLRHRNLVRLRGWCSHDQGKFLLVYDYMPNGSLDRLLFNDSLCSKLSWERRYSIAAGLGSAVQYLHEECDKVIIHRDIKSSNLLLDENFNAKLGDFGLSRQVDQGITSHTTTLAGTRGYMAPECFFGSGKATRETDVFAFGAVLLELVCGKHIIDWSLTEHEGMLVDWVWHLHSQGKVMEAVDRRLKGRYEEEEAMRVLLVGLICSSPDPKARPKMRRALEALMGSVALPVVPPYKPSLLFGPSLSMSTTHTQNSEATTTSTSSSIT